MNLMEPGSSCNGCPLQDIEDRLRESPNIPEEWKNRSPLQWFQYYLDILRQDAEFDSKSRNVEAAAIMEGFVDFVREKGITNFSEVYENSFDDDDSESEGFIPSEGAAISCTSGQVGDDEEICEIHHNGMEEIKGIDTCNPFLSSPPTREQCKHQDKRLPDVLFHCNGKETSLSTDVTISF